jgi:hypothetical protein
MRRTQLSASLLVAAALLAPVTRAGTKFVTPLDQSQLFGATVVEIATDVEGVDRVELYVGGSLAGVARTPPYRLLYDFGQELSAHVLVAKVLSGGFTRTETASITTAALTVNDSLDVDLVEVPLRIRATGRVQPGDLRLIENGVEQTVRDVLSERPAAHFAFVVDRSLSMGDGKLEAAISAIRTELSQLRADDTASLVYFNHHVEKPVPLTKGVPLADVASPSGGTSMRDAVASVTAPRRTYAIVITDGGDRNSQLSDEDALRRISGTKTIVSAIVLGGTHAAFLDRAAANTGGNVVKARTATIQETLARLLQDINGRQLVVYQSTATARGWRAIEVKARRRGVAILSARKGYFAQ